MLWLNFYTFRKVHFLLFTRLSKFFFLFANIFSFKFKKFQVFTLDIQVFFCLFYGSFVFQVQKVYNSIYIPSFFQFICFSSSSEKFITVFTVSKFFFSVHLFFFLLSSSEKIITVFTMNIQVLSLSSLLFSFISSSKSL